MATPPPGGYQQGGWYEGKQYWDGTFSQPGQINTLSNQPGAGQLVSKEVNAASAAQQGVSPEQFESYLQQQRTQGAGVPSTPAPGGTGVSGAGTSGTGISGGVGMTAPQTIDLQGLYNTAYKDAGIEALQTQYSDMEKAFIEEKNKNNDNPFLSEASRVGREAKLTSLFQERTANTLNQIATKKADVEMKMNLATKQYDINSQASKDAMNQFNNLLSMGALNNASGQDIANLTMATGLSSGMIQNAIDAAKQKNVQTQTISYDDGTNQGFAIINQQTGEIISKQVIAKSAPTAEQKNVSVADRKVSEAQQNQQNAIGDIQKGAILKDLINHYTQAGGLTEEQVYRLYNSYSPYGIAGESIEEVKEGKFAY